MIKLLILLSFLVKGFEFIFIKFDCVIVFGILFFVKDLVIVFILWIINNWLFIVDESGFVLFLLLINMVLNGVLMWVIVDLLFIIILDILLYIFFVIVGL